MKSRFFALAALPLAMAAPVIAAPGIVSTRPMDMPAGQWRIDPGHASVTARLSHMGFSLFTLRFDRIDAHFDYDPKKPSASAVAVSIDPRSINTGQPALDRELIKEPWFDAEHGKGINFVSKSIDPGDGHKGTMTGDLTIRGITRPVTLAVVFNGSGFALGAPVPHAGFSATAIVRKSEYGMTKYANLLGDDVTITIEAEFSQVPAKMGSSQ
ncbi:YceI family protein [Sphingobium sp.]|uniref:YceI family protein n=1 Tax=Sphingobium sp. TaxID=1912891 RepID=UPI0028BE7F08|nr:YceI family protein [Sphingobium sp.]